MTNTTQTKKLDLYQEVTDRIINLIEQGVAPWRCTWNKYGLARNYDTGHVYTGINMLFMNMTEHPVPYFMTFKQVKAKGGNIKKGSKAHRVYYYNVMFKDSNDNKISREQAEQIKQQGGKVKVNSFLKYYNVFNVDDVENLGIFIPEVKLNHNEKIEKCENIISSFKDAPKKVFENSDSAYYDPKRDIINMPDIKQFVISEEYYTTYFHELIHSTGHTKRLSRTGITEDNTFRSKGYSKEELIAEMGASFLSAYADINYNDITENSAAYIKGWLSVLKEDKKFIFKAAAEASKAVNYILAK